MNRNEAYRPNIGWITFFLALIAGYCDAATFVSGKSIFSSHVTGNFVFLAMYFASEIKDAEAWARLLSFPVFFLAGMVGGWLVEGARSKHCILLIEGIVLTLAGMLSILLPALKGLDTTVIINLVVLVTVFGMGLQSAFGKLFASETYVPTTMMTGNVTQAAIELGHLIRNRGDAGKASRASFKKLRVAIGAFFTGCLIGAVLSKQLGLGIIMIPGLAIIVCYFEEGSWRFKEGVGSKESLEGG